MLFLRISVPERAFILQNFKFLLSDNTALQSYTYYGYVSYSIAPNLLTDQSSEMWN